VLRVFADTHPSGSRVMRLEGSIDAGTVTLLEAEATGAGALVAVELDGVRYIDRRGLGLLRQWARQGVELRGGTLFVRTLLAQAGLSPAREVGEEESPHD